MAENFYIDNNNIKFILYFNQALKTLRLIFLAFNFSFFIGMSWIIMCKCYEDWFNQGLAESLVLRKAANPKE